MTKQEALQRYTLRLGDNALILGHRLSEMCSRAPFIEEDLALTNIALDMIGRAQALYRYVANLEGGKRDEDEIAYRREEKNYYNWLIAEQPNGDFAHVIARQLYISAFELYFYEELRKCKDPVLAGIAGKAVKEIRYHVEHARDWTIRLGDGTPESHMRMQKAIDDYRMFTGELFEMDEVDHFLLAEGDGIDLIPMKARWEKYIQDVLHEATLILPGAAYMQTGSRKGIHSENLGHILCEMQYLHKAYPDAKW